MWLAWRVSLRTACPWRMSMARGLYHSASSVGLTAVLSVASPEVNHPLFQRCGSIGAVPGPCSRRTWKSSLSISRSRPDGPSGRTRPADDRDRASVVWVAVVWVAVVWVAVVWVAVVWVAVVWVAVGTRRATRAAGCSSSWSAGAGGSWRGARHASRRPNAANVNVRSTRGRVTDRTMRGVRLKIHNTPALACPAISLV